MFAASLNLLSNDDENTSARDCKCRCDALRSSHKKMMNLQCSRNINNSSSFLSGLFVHFFHY